MDCQTSEDDCQIEAVLIKNYAAMLPTEYNKLAVRYFDKEVICAKCTETIDSSDVTICVSSTLNFHFLCLFYEHKFQGKVTEILGFSEISSEHKEILLTNCQSSQMTDEEEYFDDYSETEDYAEEALTDAEEEVEPPTKRSSSVSVGDRYSETYTIKAKQKSPERQMYEQFLKDQSATAFVNMPNPECMWGTKPEDKTARVIVKRGIVIDKEFPNGNEVHVVRTDRQDLYAITLCQTCIATNRNSYFKMQLLKDDDREIYYVFRSWGRIGSKRGSTFSETFHKLQDATSEFEHDFEFLSGNKWRERHFFNPKPDYMWLIEMDYTEIGTIICGADGHLFAAGTKSTLPQEIKEILLKVFNVKNIKRALDGYGLDLERLPMGKLTALQISRGSGLLNEAAEQIAQGSAGKVVHSKLMEISNKFYSTLPQTFGNATPTILSGNEQIEKMRRMIDALLDIQFVSHILSMTNQESAEKGLDPIDMQYKKLMTKMEVVPRNHSDFNLITQYISNGAGYTHSYKGFELLDLIRLDRYGDAANFKITFPNRKLLWHGSPIQNYPGILMQGLKIAPPDALQAGHAFGQGVYFADMISKSAGYCRVRHVEDENVGYLLLCEVALGEMKKHTWGGSGGLTSEDTQYNSIWGVGKNYPNPEEDYLHPDGYTIPLGKSIRCTETSGDAGSYLYYNEFIVYDSDQVLHRYLCRVKFLI